MPTYQFVVYSVGACSKPFPKLQPHNSLIVNLIIAGFNRNLLNHEGSLLNVLGAQLIVDMKFMYVNMVRLINSNINVRFTQTTIIGYDNGDSSRITY